MAAKKTDKHFEPAKGKTLTESFLAACRANQANRARSYLAQGADVNARDTGGFTGLLYALSAEGRPLITLLLENKADVTLASDAGQTVLHACTAPYVDELVVRGADVNAQDAAGRTPLNSIRRVWMEEDRAYKLLEHGANPRLKDKAGRDACDLMQQQVDAAAGFTGSTAGEAQLASYQRLLARMKAA